MDRLDNTLPLFRPIQSPWRLTLINALERVQRDLFCISPFLTDDVVQESEKILSSLIFHKATPLTFRVLTRFRIEDFLAGASQLEALERLEDCLNRHDNWRIAIRACDQVHAKVWVFDDQLAFVGSGNATYSGLNHNLEYGVEIADTRFIEQVVAYWSTIWEQSQPIEKHDLQNMRLFLEEVREDTELQRLGQAVAERQKETAQKYHLPPRLGTRDWSNTKETHSQPDEYLPDVISPSHAFAGETVGIQTDKNVSLIQPDLPHSEMIPTSLPKDVIDVDAYELWQALCWLHPLIEDAQEIEQMDSFSIFLFWEPSKCSLVCKLFNSDRTSQSWIDADGSSDEATWAMEIGGDDTYEIQKALKAIVHTETASEMKPRVQLAIHKEEQQVKIALPGKGEISVALYCDERVKDEHLSWSIPKKSWQEVTISHSELIRAITSLEQQWQHVRKDQELRFLRWGTEVQAQFNCSAEPPLLLLRIETSDSEEPLQEQVLGRGIVQRPWMTRSEMSIWYPDLWLILQGSLGQVKRWRLSEVNDIMHFLQHITFFPVSISSGARNVAKHFLEWSHIIFY